MLFSRDPFSRRSICGALAATVLSLSCAVPAAANTTGTTVVARYADALGTANARLPRAVRRDLAERVLLLSSYYKLDPCLLGALVSVESAWRSHAVSPVGAVGFGQLMPGTAATLDVNALEPYENLDGTARYLRRMLNRFPGRDLQTRMQLALASYNAGPAAVARYSGIPPYRETRAYVSNVLRTRRAFVAAVAQHGPLVAAVAPRREYDVAPLPAHASRFATTRTTHRKRTGEARALPVRISAVAVETPSPVRYETSRSFVARFLGLRHRVVSAPANPPDPAPDIH